MPAAKTWSTLDLQAKLKRLMKEGEQNEGGAAVVERDVMLDLLDHAGMLQRWAEKADKRGDAEK